MAGRPRKQRIIPPASEAIAARDGSSCGRPTLCTPSVTRAFAQAYSRGVSVEDAASIAGVKASQAYEWLTRGERGEEPYRTFAEQSTRGKSETIAVVADKVLRAVDQDWRAGIAWLERVDRKTFGKSYDVNVNATGLIEAVRVARAARGDDDDMDTIRLPAPKASNGSNGTNGA